MPESLKTRKATVSKKGPATLNEKSRTVEIVIASETDQVRTWDYDLGDVPEILVMSGFRMPDTGQVPLLDSHGRYSVNDVFGSVTNCVVRDDELTGIASYSDDEHSMTAFRKTKEGHLTDYSAGFTANRIMKLQENETTEIGGRTYEGPAILITEWSLKEVSTCPIGADPKAKARSESNQQQQSNSKEINSMPAPVTTESNRTDPAPAVSQIDEAQVRAEAAQEATRAEQSRIRSITEMCNTHNCSDLAENLITEGRSVDQARADVLAHIERHQQDTQMPGFRLEVGAIEKDKFRDAAIDAICFRSGIPLQNPAVGYDDLTGFSLHELARRSLQYTGHSDRGSRLEMVGRALTTSDFPIIISNIANRSLFAGFETAEETWQQWCATGSVANFLEHTSVRASESDDLEEIKEHGEYKHGSIDEAQEQYKITTYGRKYSISRQAIINDDLSILTDIPRRHGEAAARKIGDIVYAVLVANSAMGDETALFHSSHKNLMTAAAVGVDSLALAIKAMKSQKDMKGKRRLNIRPHFFLAPVSLEGSAEVFFKSERYDLSDAAATRVNPYAGKYFQRIYEPRLDDASEKSWYLAGAKGKHVKIFFLDGNQKPYMETQQGWNVDGVEYKVRIDAGAKAMDWRALLKNPGAN